MLARSMSARGSRSSLPDPPAMADTIRAFLGKYPGVRLREGGRVVARMDSGLAGYSLADESNRLVCHFWSESVNLVRRVVAVSPEKGGQRLRLDCQRLGRSQREPLLLEPLEAASGEGNLRREEFRRIVETAIGRDWHGWRTEPGTWHGAASRSPVQRLLLRRGSWLIPCVAVSEDETAAAAVQALAQALAWAEQVKVTWPQSVIAALRLILPPSAESLLRERCRWLLQPPDAPALEFYRLDASAGQLNPAPAPEPGNAATGLRRAPGAIPQPGPEVAQAEALLALVWEYCPQATLERGPDGLFLFRQYGLEFARESNGVEALAAAFNFGLGAERTPLNEATRSAFLQLLRQLGAERVPGGSRRHWLYSLHPERWLEHVLRADPSCLDPAILGREVYSQVPLCVGGERDVLDLLAADREARLHVLELKADEDLGFPLQALDYWSRVQHHLREGDFERLGYFPGRILRRQAPRLCLIAPALRWHPRTDAIMEWLQPSVPWVRIGLNEEWRRGIQVVYRKEASHA